MTNLAYAAATIGSERHRFTFSDLVVALKQIGHREDDCAQYVRDDGRVGAYLVIRHESEATGWEMRLIPLERHFPQRGMMEEQWVRQTPDDPFWAGSDYRQVKLTIRPLGQYSLSRFENAVSILKELTARLESRLEQFRTAPASRSSQDSGGISGHIGR